MKKVFGCLLIVLLAFGAACGGDDDNDGSGQSLCPNGQTHNKVTGECRNGSDAGTQDTSSEDGGATDTGRDSGSADSGQADASGQDGSQHDASQEDASAQDASQQDASQQEGGTLYGVVTRKASSQPEEDGVGSLYIAVFGEDPIANPETDQLVGFQLVEDANLAAETAEVAYRVEGIPPRDEAYYVTAFLDDDNTADPSDPSTAGPDAGDLVAVDNFFPPSSPQVTVDQEVEVEFDILLNFNMF